MSRPDTLLSGGEPADGWVSAEGGVAASSVVVGEEAVKAAAAELVAGPGPGVGPFGEQGPVEPFGLAVGPGAAGFGEAAFELPGRADPAPVGAVPVDQRVVGQHPADADAVAGEPGQGPVQEPGAGRVLLIRQGFGVGQAGVVVDRGVHEVVADLRLL